MRFGFVVPNNWGIDDPVAVAELGVEAEGLGLDSVFVNHHIVNAGYIADRLGDKPYHDALTVLTWMAARTERILLGTSVLVMPYLHPMVTAKALATLDQMSAGRVIAGLGVGSLPDENEILGVDYANRGPAGDEFIEVMRALWTQPSASHRGVHYSFDNVVASPRPVGGDIPVWIGGSGTPARRRAATHGAAWHPMVSVGGLARRMPKMIAALETNDRTRADLVVAPRIDVAAVPDPAAVDDWEAAGADQLIVSVNSHDIEDHRAGLHHVADLQRRSNP